MEEIAVHQTARFANALLWTATAATLALWPCPSQAADAEAAPGKQVLQHGTPYLTVQVGIELHAIEKAAQEVSRSVDDLAVSVRTLTKSPSLSEEQKAELTAVLGRVDKLSGRVVAAMDRMPEAVKESRDPLVSIAADLAGDVRLTIILTLVVALLVVILALVGVYLFTIRPAGKMVVASSARLMSLTGSLERAIGLASETNSAQLELAKILDAQRVALDGYKADAVRAKGG